MKRTYISPSLLMVDTITESFLTAPSTYSVSGTNPEDKTPPLPISHDDSDEMPTGAKGTDFLWEEDMN